jgi:mono/diheme cytochrome c family protein
MNRMNLAVVMIAIAGTAAAAGAQSSGADVYKAKCVMCHAADGSGSTPAGKSMKVEPFTAPDLVKASESDLVSLITNGKGKMPAYAGKLTDEQIKDVTAYIRKLQKQ